MFILKKFIVFSTYFIAAQRSPTYLLVSLSSRRRLLRAENALFTELLLIMKLNLDIITTMASHEDISLIDIPTLAHPSARAIALIMSNESRLVNRYCLN